MADAYKRYGYDGEELASAYLTRNNYTVLTKNFRVHAVGEIDLIALKGDVLAIIEVKHWRRYPFPQLEYAIDCRKRERLIQTTRVFLQNNPVYKICKIRFDVIFINEMRIHHLRAVIE